MCFVVFKIQLMAHTYTLFWDVRFGGVEMKVTIFNAYTKLTRIMLHSYAFSLLLHLFMVFNLYMILQQKEKLLMS